MDQRDIPDSLVHLTTAWGCDDEAAFNYTLQQCDKSFSSKSFFNHIMTVSNHRPYIYPEGRIDIDPTYQSIQEQLSTRIMPSINSLKKLSKNPGSTIPCL
ncbi:MAG: hypothetical protein IPI88_16340 [Chitinophagaceae bacterium]|nr:hypothetical protein [Chitinophagaceae bacterium]